MGKNVGSDNHFNNLITGQHDANGLSNAATRLIASFSAERKYGCGR